MSKSGFIGVFLSVLALAGCGASESKSSETVSSSSSIQGICPLESVTCSAGELKVVSFDENSCKIESCEPDDPAGKAPVDESLPVESVDHDNSGVGTAVPPAEGAYCDVSGNNQAPRYITPADGYVARYSSVIQMGYYPIKGRYAPGIHMFCERDFIRCIRQDRIAGRNTHARLLEDRDQSRCGKDLFNGHPEYNYEQYKEWMEAVDGYYKLCKKRSAAPEEVKAAIDLILEKDHTLEDAMYKICGT